MNKDNTYSYDNGTVILYTSHFVHGSFRTQTAVHFVQKINNKRIHWITT